MKIKEGYVIRKVMGNYVVIATGEESKNFHGMVKLNETAAKIWECVCAGKDIDGIVASMLEEYEVDEKQLRADVEKALKTLAAQGFLEL